MEIQLVLRRVPLSEYRRPPGTPRSGSWLLQSGCQSYCRPSACVGNDCLEQDDAHRPWGPDGASTRFERPLRSVHTAPTTVSNPDYWRLARRLGWRRGTTRGPENKAFQYTRNVGRRRRVRRLIRQQPGGCEPNPPFKYTPPDVRQPFGVHQDKAQNVFIGILRRTVRTLT